MDNLEFDEQSRIKKDIDKSYRLFVDDIIIQRFILVSFIGLGLHLSFYFLDRIAYPASAAIFLKIRIINTLIVLPFLLLACIKKLKPLGAWMTDISCTAVILSHCLMIYISNGSSSRYYEGANLVFLFISVINPFYLRHLIGCFILWIGLYQFAMLGNHQHFNLLNYTLANYFMSSTALLVLIMSKFYKDQHYKAFVRQEQLKINEKTLADLYSQADKLSKTDTLTEINNRRHFSDMLNKKIQGSEAVKIPFYLVIFDVDFFKKLNDTYGHAFGDIVLVKVVDVVRKNIRSNDFVGRFGGDEFIICLDLSDKERILDRLILIRSGVRSLILTHEGHEVPISISIGAAKFRPGTKMTEEKLMEKADFELFNVKKTARGEISINE